MSREITVRKACSGDYGFILRENKNNVEYLSPMDEARLAKLAGIAEFVLVAECDGEPAAFLIAFREGTDEYDSENYRWFNSHYSKFLYIDRVVVNDSFRHLGIGRRLYEEVFGCARNNGVEYVTAEIDLIPFNGNSLEFQKSMGFKEVGIQTVRNGTVKVSLQEAKVSP